LCKRVFSPQKVVRLSGLKAVTTSETGIAGHEGQTLYMGHVDQECTGMTRMVLPTNSETGVWKRLSCPLHSPMSEQKVRN